MANKKNRKIILILLIITLGCGLMSYWQFKKFKTSLSKVKPPQFEIPEFEFYPTPKNESYKEFISPDGKLELKYSTNWIEIDERVLGELNQEVKKIKNNKTLFLAQQFKAETALLFLMIQESKLKNPKEIIEEIKKDVKEAGGEIEFVKLNIENNIAEFEARYKQKTGYDFYSREKIISTELNSYLITILSLEKDWPKIEEEVNQIFDSIQFTP